MPPTSSPQAEHRNVGRVAVIGAGTMGGGIAMAFANVGLRVHLIDVSPEALARGRAAIEKNYRIAVARGSLAPGEVDRRLERIAGCTDLTAIADADLVIEAVFEDMEVKRKLFAQVDRLARPGAVLATNTSFLDVNVIAQATGRPSEVVGLHFFSPANVMRLVEVVRAETSAPDVVATAVAVARALGKIPVVVGVCHGFVGNRMFRVRAIAAERLLLEGALPQDVDAALAGFGFAMGPFAVSDLIGLDILRKAQGPDTPIAEQLCEMGRLGQKTGRGFYRYEAGSRKPAPDPDVQRLIAETAARLDVPRVPIGAGEMVERLLFPMVNEGARILEEGIASRPGDIDLIWVHGYGFPAARGGPLHYADTVGLGYVRDRLITFAGTTGDERLRPSALLERLANLGQGFASLQ